ncbi:HNH endonuclease family protein [Luteimicrobium subarcticum]|uniref:HNH endonuclease family protein n=1 Tax=Luteimicrobium subarcticum TaxID=620910 RepID=UPI001FE54C8C|nr:HNH endonuclease family protein [Luteimicrobium subarcticum]
MHPQPPTSSPATARRPRRAARALTTGTTALVLTTALAALAGCAPATEGHAAATRSGHASAGASKPRATTTDRPQASPAPRKTPSTRSSGGTTSTAGSAGTAVTVLATLPVKGRAPMTGYERDQFGPAWADVDHNGCDTRNDILARDLTHVTTKAGTHGCTVLTGTLADPYSGRAIAFQRGATTSTAVQIDHVVALADAWQTGAQKLSADQREAYANDPYVLLAADGPLNGQKGAGDAATWLPPNKAFRCQYVARQIGIKHKYHLWVTAAEHDAMEYVLATCPTQPVPTGGGAVVKPTGAASASTPHATATSTPAAKAATGGTAGKHPSVAQPVSHWDCPSWAPIKGNASSHIYHVPGGAYYDRTAPEVCFASASAAVADGYRASKR